MSKTIFVTGATGFLGTHLCKSLADLGCRVVALYRDLVTLAEFWKDGAKDYVLVHGDIRDRALMERILADYGVDCVVHLAAQAQVSVGSSDPTGTFDVNFNGTLSVLEACRRVGTKRVVVAATDKCYGENLNAKESDPLNERTPYGASKACADILAQTYLNSFGMSIAITRCGNLYGPGHLNWSTLIPGTIKRILSKEKPVVRFGGTAIRDFLYVQDAVVGYQRLIDSTVTGAFNMSGGEPRQIIDIVRMLLDLSGMPPDFVDIKEGGTGEIKGQGLDCGRALADIWWRPVVTLEKGLKETFEWYRENLGVKGESYNDVPKVS